MQDDSVLSTVSYLEYTLLYTNFIRRRYVAEIFVYGVESYLDKRQQVVGHYDLTFLFVYFNNLWNDLLEMRKRYVGKVTARDIATYMLSTIHDFYSYLASIARRAIAECVGDKGNKALVDIDKNEEFFIDVGDYMNVTETIYTEFKNKSTDRLIKWVNERIEKKLIFGDYSGLEFSKCFFKNIDLRFSHFRGSSLRFSSFEGSSLIGTSFRDANMEECCFDNCAIHEADFSNTIIKKATFKNVDAKTGIEDKDNWHYPGFLPIVFCNADLTKADFSGANLLGADFSNAVLSDINFTNANLQGAIFSGAIIKGTELTNANIEAVDFSSAVLTDIIYPM